MRKDLSYYESAIEYNAAIAEFAEQVAPTLKNEEVRRWCLALAKKHRFHETKHRRALETVRARYTSPPDTDKTSGLQMVVSATGTVIPSAEANATATTEVEDNVLAEGDTLTLPDGCTQFHDPSNPNCEFFPSISQGNNNG